jgi:uncharacterized membrane protein
VTPRRLEAFSDGVFAIAATLLIIDVGVDLHGERLGVALAHAWPQYAAYATSFLTIGVMWVNHHATIDLVARVDRAFLFLNLGLLLCVAFVPFPTRLVAEFIRTDDGQAAALAYGATLTITAIFFQGYWRYAIARGLLRPDADPRVVSGISRAFRPGVAVYAAAAALSYVSPWLSVAIYSGLVLFYMVESSFLGGRLSG